MLRFRFVCFSDFQNTVFSEVLFPFIFFAIKCKVVPQTLSTVVRETTLKYNMAKHDYIAGRACGMGYATIRKMRK